MSNQSVKYLIFINIVKKFQRLSKAIEDSDDGERFGNCHRFPERQMTLKSVYSQLVIVLSYVDCRNQLEDCSITLEKGVVHKSAGIHNEMIGLDSCCSVSMADDDRSQFSVMAIRQIIVVIRADHDERLEPASSA